MSADFACVVGTAAAAVWVGSESKVQRFSETFKVCTEKVKVLKIYGQFS